MILPRILPKSPMSEKKEAGKKELGKTPPRAVGGSMRVSNFLLKKKGLNGFSSGKRDQKKSSCASRGFT